MDGASLISLSKCFSETLTDVTDVQNSCFQCVSVPHHGGAIYMLGERDLKIKSSIFYRCSVTKEFYGGAMYVGKGECEIEFTCFLQCLAFDEGSAINFGTDDGIADKFVSHFTEFTLCGGDNAEQEGATRVNTGYSDIHATNSSLNRATRWTGGFALNGGTSSIRFSTFARNGDFQPLHFTGTNTGPVVVSCNLIDNAGATIFRELNNVEYSLCVLRKNAEQNWSSSAITFHNCLEMNDNDDAQTISHGGDICANLFITSRPRSRTIDVIFHVLLLV